MPRIDERAAPQQRYDIKENNEYGKPNLAVEAAPPRSMPRYRPCSVLRRLRRRFPSRNPNAPPDSNATASRNPNPSPNRNPPPSGDAAPHSNSSPNRNANPNPYGNGNPGP